MKKIPADLRYDMMLLLFIQTGEMHFLKNNFRFAFSYWFQMNDGNDVDGIGWLEGPGIRLFDLCGHLFRTKKQHAQFVFDLISLQQKCIFSLHSHGDMKSTFSTKSPLNLHFNPFDSIQSSPL